MGKEIINLNAIAYELENELISSLVALLCEKGAIELD